MSDFFELSGIDKDSLFAELDRDFYKAFPKEWDKDDAEFFIRGQEYTAIIGGQGNSHRRERQPGERVTSGYIERDGYHLWEVGRVYIVKHHDSKMRRVSLSGQEIDGDKISEGHQVEIDKSDVIGRLRLVDIRVGKRKLFSGNPIYDELVFEKVND